MTSPSSRPPPGQGHRRGAAATNDVVPAAITFAALGLDISQAEVVACLLLADGSEVVPRWTIPNSLPGAQALAERVQALAKAQGIKELRIGLEATGLYWWHLACFLKETPALTEVHQTIYVFNPALVQGLKRVYADAGKTDRLDAFFIAERLRVGRLPQPFQPNLVYAPLQRLTRFRAHLGQTLAREKNYCLALLFLPFSAFGQEAPFDDLFSPTSLGILETFTTEELAQASLEDLAPFVQQHGRGRFADPRQVATTLKQAACHSYRLAPGLDEPLKLILTTTLATIRTLQGQLRAVDRTIAQDMAARPAARRTLDSVPGLGPVWTAGRLSEIGDIFRIALEAALAKFAGLVWKPRESGDFQGEDTALAKTGNPFLRYYLIEAANSVRQHCPEYRDYYNAKLARVSQACPQARSGLDGAQVRTPGGCEARGRARSTNHPRPVKTRRRNALDHTGRALSNTGTRRWRRARANLPGSSARTRASDRPRRSALSRCPPAWSRPRGRRP